MPGDIWGGEKMLSQKVLDELRSYIVGHQGIVSYVRCMEYAPLSLPQDSDLDDFISRRKKPGFSQTLLQMIDNHGGKDSEIYSRAGLDRRHFSKIRSNPNYQPNKSTAIALALALELGREAADTLLAAAGYTLSDSETFDLVIAWCLEKGVYDLSEVNQALDYFSQKTIGTTA